MPETNNADVNSTGATYTAQPDTAVIEKFNIATFEHPGVPPVCNLRRASDKKYFPLLVFGFPITTRDKDDFAGRTHLISSLSPNAPYNVKREEAFIQLMRQVPRKYKRYTPMLQLVELNDKPALCVVLGTNQTEEDLDVTLNMTMIEKIHEILQTYYPPQWFVLGG